jgi:hypothetical protein
MEAMQVQEVGLYLPGRQKAIPLILKNTRNRYHDAGTIDLSFKSVSELQALLGDQLQAKQTDIADSLGRRRAGLKIPADPRRDSVIRSGGCSSGGRSTPVSFGCTE